MQKLQVYSEDEKRKAAYALNLCTVSISQIVDYNDVYVMEQEYNAILNNLNLEAMPKDEALLKILVETLNTITFFRIQELKKQKVESDYQRRMKNAIWSAVPNLSVIVAGNPIAMVLSVATQVGTAYMNYRREKANAGIEKENSEFELQITAMEQFHALQRELFTTAWRLADSYGFKDEWRLTENQIKQYDQVLMDADEYRKYARLEAIAPNFEAYPPFWYFYAHTALYISENETNAVAKAEYRNRAKNHFEKYYQLNRFSLLREDQLAASALLEYSDLLLLENAKENTEKVYQLVMEAQKKAGNANDVLQLCAISYLKIGKTEDAARLLKYLVNEEYNSAMNAKILSRIYVSQYLATESPAAYTEYGILARRIAPEFLFPMPKGTVSDQSLEEAFIKRQKVTLIKAYRTTLQDYARKTRDDYEDALQDLEKSCYKKETVALLVSKLVAGEYSRNCVVQLNQMVAGLDTLPAFRNLEKREALIKLIEGTLRNTRPAVRNLQKETVNTFDEKDYKNLAERFSYQQLTEKFFDILKARVTDKIADSQELGTLNLLENDLLQFCDAQELPMPQCLNLTQEKQQIPEGKESRYFDDVFLEDAPDSETQKQLKEKMEKIIGAAKGHIIKDAANAAIYLRTEKLFDIYFENSKMTGATKYLVKQKAVAVIDDKTNRDCDLILTIDGVVIVNQNRISDEKISYDAIKFDSEAGTDRLTTSYRDICDNAAIDLKELYALMQELDKLA
ncbi:hypothetical protein [Faecalibacterium prausnitzii]|uniref:Uncharacterized protein n=1 Tax=Faecalibacterium prausnitzii TaxID=853 RepID=A0A2A7ACV0_9FIRM|nr:hypothetical protein [Faecalibacterium prausnitzii]PDX76931.1 hypothetical protein CGS56_00620 [Faecalibacterium prausnitzii]